MTLILRNTRTNRSTDYTVAYLYREARSVAKGRGKIRRWWVEIFDTTERASLRVEIARPDGLGEILNVAI